MNEKKLNGIIEFITGIAGAVLLGTWFSWKIVIVVFLLSWSFGIKIKSFISN